MNNLQSILNYTKTLNILLVEEHNTSRETASLLFEDIFNSVVSYTHIEDAINEFIKNEIDLVISDLTMPNFKGVELVKSINKISPIFIFTTHTEKYILKKVEELNITSLIHKPFDIEELFNSLLLLK